MTHKASILPLFIYEECWIMSHFECRYQDVLRLFSRYLKETQVGLLSLLVLGLAGMVGSPSIRWSKIIWWYPSLWWSRSHYEWKYWLWWSIRILWSPSLGHPKGISIGSMDFDNPKVYSDTSIFDGLVVHGIFMICKVTVCLPVHLWSKAPIGFCSPSEVPRHKSL